VNLKRMLECAKEVGYLTRHDEPYMEVMVEYQDWRQSDGTEKLLVGYFFEENGDVCFDPLLSFVIRHGDVEKVIYSSWMGITLDVTKDSFAYAFVDTVWQRHFSESLINEEVAQ